MTERKKLGCRVSADVIEAFKEDVKRRKGQVRGVFGDEVETAMREYLSDNNDVTDSERLKRIEDRMARLEQNMGAVTADGGVDTSEGGPHTHAPSRVEAAASEKPGANAATEKKVRYLAERVRDEAGGSDGSLSTVPKKVLVNVVKEEYGFRSDTAKRYVDELVSHFGLVQYPNSTGVYCTPERREQELNNRTENNNHE